MKIKITLIVSIGLLFGSCTIRKYKTQALYSKNRQLYWIDWDHKFPQEYQEPKRQKITNY